MDGDYQKRFGGVARLYGAVGLDRLRRAHVMVIGIGGVGSWVVEALARSGVGALTMVDLDDVCITNTNRQLPALDGHVGRPKAIVLQERIALINPECRVEAKLEFFTASTADALMQGEFDYVVDAVDKLSHKCLIITSARSRGIPVLTVGGAGGRRESSAVQVVDLADSKQDELLRQVRRKLRRECGFPRESGSMGVTCVYSPEKPLYPWSNGAVCAEREPGSEVALDCSTGFGTASFVTGAFGFAAAGAVVNQIALGS